MDRRGEIHIGLSGWHYLHWKGRFYPEGMDTSQFLRYCAGRFGTIEVNNSFYRLPTRETMAAWRDAVPKGFLFAVKASRFITHIKKLKDPVDSLKMFFDRVDVMGDKLGPLLFLLPPWWKFNGERFQAFLKDLPDRYRYVMEFRNETWFRPDVYDALRERNISFCLTHLGELRSPMEVTADFVYVRLHGPGGAYKGRYNLRTLKMWAERFQGWAGEGKDVYCYFDNDEKAYAPFDALRVKQILKDERVSVVRELAGV